MDDESPHAPAASANRGSFSARAEAGLSRSSTQDSADRLDTFTPPLGSPRDSLASLDEDVQTRVRYDRDHDQGAKAGAGAGAGAEAKLPRSPLVSLSLVESSLGLSGSVEDDAEDKMGYVVEEASDDD